MANIVYANVIAVLQSFLSKYSYMHSYQGSSRTELNSHFEFVFYDWYQREGGVLAHGAGGAGGAGSSHFVAHEESERSSSGAALALPRSQRRRGCCDFCAPSPLVLAVL